MTIGVLINSSTISSLLACRTFKLALDTTGWRPVDEGRRLLAGGLIPSIDLIDAESSLSFVTVVSKFLALNFLGSFNCNTVSVREIRKISASNISSVHNRLIDRLV